MSDIHVRETSKAEEAARKPTPDLNRISSINKRLSWQYAASADGFDSNLLILLHGLGDTCKPFFTLGKSLNLPQTAVLSLQAPDAVPLLEEQAFQWYPSFDELGELITRPDPSSALFLLQTILSYLQEHCAWPAQAIHLFGFAQGGSVAAQSVLASGLRLGSVCSVGGPLLSFPTSSIKSPTPVLLWRRSQDAATNAGAFRRGFASVTEHVAAGAAEQGMPRGQPEWLPIMKFWSQSLRKLQPWELAGEHSNSDASTVHEVVR